MSKGSLNKVMLIGNLGDDPETRYMPSNMAVTNVRIATSESWKDKNTGEAQERTEWHRVVFFRRSGRGRATVPAQGLQDLCRGPVADP